MTIDKLWEQYQHYTRDITEHGRNLGFAGFAVCWLFKSGEYRFPPVIYIALLIFVVYFIVDVCQPLLAALAIRAFTRKSEIELWRRTHSHEGDVQVPWWLDGTAFWCFIGKCVLLALGFIALFIEAIRRLGAG